MAQAQIAHLPRPQMRDITKLLLANLQARAAAGPPEPGLDAYIPELTTVSVRLDTHVGGKELADATRRAQLATLEVADDDVDTWLRHNESFLRIESIRRSGAHVGAAQALHAAAFQEGVEPTSYHIPDENRYCRTALGVLRAQEHQATLAAIEYPTSWLTRWEDALDRSDAAFQDVEKARLDRSQHVGHGEDAEADFVELAVRLRRYVQSRASRSDKERVAEGERLLAPLLNALKKMKAEQQARATRRENGEAAPPPPMPAPTPTVEPTPAS